MDDRPKTEPDDLSREASTRMSVRGPSGANACPRCNSEKTRLIPELFGAPPAWYCDDCKNTWRKPTQQFYASDRKLHTNGQAQLLACESGGKDVRP